MMPKKIQFEGEVHEFPDTFTDAQIASALKTYKNRVNPSRDLVYSPLPESTIGSRTREAAIGVLEPFTAQSLGSTAKSIGQAGYDVLTGKVLKSGAEIRDLLKGLVKAPIQPLVNLEEGFRTGDYDRAAYGAGGFLSQTVPAVAGAAEGVAKVGGFEIPRIGPEIPKIPEISPIVALKSKARSIAQRATGQTAADTTGKAFKEYSEEAAKVSGKQAEAQSEATAKTKEKQSMEDTRTAERNKTAAIAARVKNEAAQQKFQTQAKTAEEEAGTQTREQEAQFEKTQQLHIDSGRLGKMAEDLNGKVKEEAYEKYKPVHEGTAGDAGETLIDQARTAQSFLKGSSENIKQFREVLRGEAEAEGFMSQAAGHPLEKILEGEDPLARSNKYKFEDIQGYKQELDAKLGSGNLLPDVYRALESFRDSLDAAMKTIADRNNVRPQLEEANAFYRDWKQLFTDNMKNESALGDVLNRVKRKTTDPEFYHEPFTKGKASGVAIDRLRNLKTKYAADANQLADLGKQLRDRFNTGEKPANYLGERPAPVTPKDVAPPTPVRARQSAARTIPPVKPKPVPVPEEPNVGELIQKRAEAVGQKGRNMQQITAYDLRRLGLPVLGGIVTGHPWAGLITGVGIEALTKGVGYALDIDKVKKFIAAPTEADVTAAHQLPEPARSNVIKGLRDIIDKEKAAGRSVPIAPAVQQLISHPSNRQQAMDLLNSKMPFTKSSMPGIHHEGLEGPASSEPTLTYNKAEDMFAKLSRARYGTEHDLTDWLGTSATGPNSLVRGKLPEFAKYSTRDVMDALKRLRQYKEQ